MPHCPNCQHDLETIDYECDYNEYGSAWGTCSPDGSDREETGRECNDGDEENYHYTCPHCEQTVDPDDLDDDDEDEDEDDNEEPIAPVNIEDNTNLVRPVSVTRSSDGGHITRVDSTPNQQINIRSTSCPNCQAINYLEGDNAIICINCNQEITV